MADQPKKGGKGLAKNKYVWIGAGLILLYVAYRYYSNGNLSSSLTGPLTSSNSGSSSPATGTTDTSGSSLGGATSAGSPSDNGAATSDLLNAYGSQQAGLLSAFENLNQDVLGIAQSQIQAAQTQTALTSTNQNTQPQVTAQPGGSIAPIINFIMPSTTSQTTAAQKTVAAPKTPPKYFTYKSQVPLSANQSIHFQAGRGYYAATG